MSTSHDIERILLSHRARLEQADVRINFHIESGMWSNKVQIRISYHHASETIDQKYSIFESIQNIETSIEDILDEAALLLMGSVEQDRREDRDVNLAQAIIHGTSGDAEEEEALQSLWYDLSRRNNVEYEDIVAENVQIVGQLIDTVENQDSSGFKGDTGIEEVDMLRDCIEEVDDLIKDAPIRINIDLEG